MTRHNDSWNDVRQWIRNDDEIRALSLSVGYSAYLDIRSRELWPSLSNLTVDIPNFAGFEAALDVTIRFFGQHPSLWPDRPLFEQVVAQRVDSSAVLAALRSNPERMLPGEAEAQVARCPSHRGPFTDALKELESLFQNHWYLPEWRHTARAKLLEAVADVREGLNATIPNVGRGLHSLGLSIERYVRFISEDEVAEARRRTLDDVLFSLVCARDEYRRGDFGGVTEVAAQTRIYIDCAFRPS